MAKATSTKLRIKSGTFELDFDGNEAFLRTEVPKLVTAANKLHASEVSAAAVVLQQQIGESLSTKAELDAAKDELKTVLDSMSELGEIESLRLQMALDRLSKLMSTLSNILKKINETAGSITQNLK